MGTSRRSLALKRTGIIVFLVAFSSTSGGVSCFLTRCRTVENLSYGYSKTRNVPVTRCFAEKSENNSSSLKKNIIQIFQRNKHKNFDEKLEEEIGLKSDEGSSVASTALLDPINGNSALHATEEESSSPTRFGVESIVKDNATAESSSPSFEGLNLQVQSQYYPIDTDIPSISYPLGDKMSPVQSTQIFQEAPPLQESFLERQTDTETYFEAVIPIVTPFISYLSYDYVAKSFEFFMEFLSEQKNWIAVDGGAYQAKIIAPLMNGIVVPAIAVLFATLTSTTISTLRTRQVAILRAINMEAGELRALEAIISAFPDGRSKERFRNYLIQYTNRIISESQPSVGSGNGLINPRRGMDSELNGLIQLLSQEQESIPGLLAGEAFASAARLREQRYDRITALQSTYPILHYFILGKWDFVTRNICVPLFLMQTIQLHLRPQSAPVF